MLDKLLSYPGRLSRWARFAVRPPELTLIHHRDYASAAIGPLMDPARADKILAFLNEEGLVRRPNVVRPLPASLENILRVHTREYVELLSDPEVVGEILGVQLNRQTAEASLDLARLMVGGTIQATRLALRSGKVVVHLGGGFHHATPTEGMGFCIYNDIAVAIARLRARGFEEPVLVVDLDLHDGNGTRAAFAQDPSVLTFSIHNVPWDSAEAVASKAIALGSGVTDAVLLETLKAELPPIVERHRPGLVVYVAGVDGAASDALGDWKLTEEGILERDRFVVDTIAAHGDPPLVVLLAGGYGASSWRYSARFLGWLAAGTVIEPPDAIDLLVRQFREVSKRWSLEQSHAPVDDEWSLKGEELFGLVVQENTDFLGQFSKHAVELQLEQLGVLHRMRARGYSNVTLSFSAAQGLGQVLRVHANGDDLLMELKASRSRSIVPGAEVIELEWLLMQNPRATFTERRPQLPGQTYPGLGMLRDIAAWLVVVCEELRLDGIAFVPSQYYMAALGHHHLQFVHPEAEARYDALRRTLRGLDLATANRVLNEGRVVDAETGETISWEPTPMAVPVSDDLLTRTNSRRYQETLERAREAFQFRLRDAVD